MRLTRVLNVVFPRKRHYGGLVYEGVNQRTRPMKTSYKYSAANDVARESQNLAYLSKPYLNHEECTMYYATSSAKDKKREQFYDMIQKQKKFFPDMTLEEHLEPLNQNKKWE